MNYKAVAAFDAKMLAVFSYEIADAMIAQRKNKEEEQQ